jgi:hypothetical protein
MMDNATNIQKKSFLQPIPAVVALIHFVICLAIAVGQAEGSWGWFVAFLLDLPFSILLLYLPQAVPPFISFGILGTAWWYFLVFFLIRFCSKIRQWLARK